jgi:PAS domain S-box-containing protein
MCQDTQLLAQIAEEAPDIIGAYNVRGQLAYLNRAGRARLGVAANLIGAAGLSHIELYPPAVAAMIRDTALPAAERDGVWRGESTLRDSAGLDWPVEQVVFVHRDSAGSVSSFSTIIRDATAQRLAEQALRDSEERFSKAFYASPVPYIIVDHTTHLMVDVNDAYSRLFGVSREEAVGKKNSELGLWVDLKERDRFIEIMDRDGEAHEMEQRRCTRAGEAVICLVTAFRMNIGGRPCILYQMRDITRERRSEQALRDSEEKFSRAFRATPDSVVISTFEEGRILDVNEGFTRLHGWTREEAVGRTGHELRLWGDASHRIRVMSMLREGRSVRSMPVVARNRAGGLHQCLYSGETTEIGGTLCLISIIRDMTEQQRLEAQLHHAQKMESVGQLAGGVAHDFNNILTVIQGHTSLLLGDARLPPEMLESLRQIAHSADFAAKLTRQLLLFGRKQVIQLGRLELNGVVTRMTQLLERVIGENIALELGLTPGLPEIHADTGMVEQLLLNLVVNARDAMPAGGRVAISTQALDADAEYVRRVPQARCGRYVGLRVRDTGEGISPEILPRIFDPFFTTKKEGKGTGLGLATAYGIVEQHSGWIEVDSQPRQGAQFTVWFPATAPHAVEPRPVSVPPIQTRGGETILVVEDKDAVRAIVRAVLTRFGYKVVLAADGQEALLRWAEHQGQIMLLFTDVIMPGGMTGRDLAIRLRTMRPDLKVIFCSGYDADILGPTALKEPGTRFLAKPFDVGNLAQIVRELLNAG